MFLLLTFQSLTSNLQSIFTNHRDIKCTINLVEDDSPFGDSISSILKGDDFNFSFLKSWTLDQLQFLSLKIDVILSDTSKLNSKVYSSLRVDLLKDIIETEAFKVAYNPFFGTVEDFELNLIPNSKFPECKTVLTMNLSLFSRPMNFEVFLLRTGTDFVKNTILETLNSKINEMIERNPTESEMESIGRIHEQIEFIDILEDYKKKEKFKSITFELFNHLKRFEKNPNTKKYQIITEEEATENIHSKEDDLKQLQLFESKGFEKEMSEYSTLNMLRIILTYKNNRQAKLFCEKYCDSLKKVSKESYPKLERAVEFYNAMVEIREKQHQLKK
jgi:hypothetical protein